MFEKENQLSIKEQLKRKSTAVLERLLGFGELGLGFSVYFQIIVSVAVKQIHSVHNRTYSVR